MVHLFVQALIKRCVFNISKNLCEYFELFKSRLIIAKSDIDKKASELVLLSLE